MIINNDKSLIDLAKRLIQTAVALDCPILQSVCQRLRISSRRVLSLINDDRFSEEARSALRDAVDFINDRAAAGVFDKAVSNEIDARVFNIAMKNVAGWQDKVEYQETKTLNINFKKIETIEDKSKLIELYRDSVRAHE